MSHITEIEIAHDDNAVVDLEVLELAAEITGGQLVRDQKTYKCYPGGWMGDTKPPEWWSPEMWGKCDHAIRYPDCDYEVGLVERDGKFKIVWDYWSQGGLLDKLGGNEAPLLKTAIANAATTIRDVRAVTRAATMRGDRVRVSKLPNNQIQMMITTR